LTDNDTIIINVAAVNDAPVNTVPATQNISEDTTLTFTVGNAITVSDVDAGGGDLKVTLHVETGSLDVVDASGLGISGDKSADVVLTGTLSEINAGLNGMVFTPGLNFNGAAHLSITTDDQ